MGMIRAFSILKTILFVRRCSKQDFDLLILVNFDKQYIQYFSLDRGGDDHCEGAEHGDEVSWTEPLRCRY